MEFGKRELAKKIGQRGAQLHYWTLIDQQNRTVRTRQISIRIPHLHY